MSLKNYTFAPQIKIYQTIIILYSWEKEINAPKKVKE